MRTMTSHGRRRDTNVRITAACPSCGKGGLLGPFLDVRQLLRMRGVRASRYRQGSGAPMNRRR